MNESSTPNVQQYYFEKSKLTGLHSSHEVKMETTHNEPTFVVLGAVQDRGDLIGHKKVDIVTLFILMYVIKNLIIFFVYTMTWILTAVHIYHMRTVNPSHL